MEKYSQKYISQLHDAVKGMKYLHILDGKRVCITGASGMIGTALIHLLMTYNEIHNCHIMVQAVGRNEARIQETFAEYLQCADFSYEIADINVELPNLQGMDFIIHAASNTHPIAYATDPVGTIQTNVWGLKNLLDKGIKHHIARAVFLSSVEIYGENRGDIERFREDDCGYLDCNTLRAGYPEGKRLGEALCQAYRQQYEMEIVIPRLSRVYGPTMLMTDSKAISQFMKKAATGEDIILKSQGSQLYSYCYSVDAAEAILFLMCNGRDGEAYNVSDRDAEITLKDLAQRMADIVHSKVIYELPEETEQRGYSKATKALLDTGKIEAMGWKPRVNLQQGLEITIEALQRF